MIPFPTLPEEETGTALGATVLNSYHKGVRYMLGRSHEPTALQTIRPFYTFYDTWQLAISWFLPYRGDRVSYHYDLSCMVDVSAAGYIELRYVGDDTAEHVVLADQIGPGGPPWYEKIADGVFTAGIDYGTSMTAGNIYEWKLYVKANTGYDATCTWWELTSYYDAVTGWVAPHTFVADAVSAAADLNGFRTDLNAIKTYRLDMAKGLTTCPSIFPTSGADWYLHCAWFAYRYRPDHLRCNVWCQSVGGAPYHWMYRVSALKWGDGKFAHLPYDLWEVQPAAEQVLYTSPDWIEQIGDEGMWGVEADIDMSGTGLVMGDWVMIFFEVLGTAVVNLQVHKYICQRYSSGTPEAGYEALTDWAEGDDDIGPTNLNKISTDLLHFYTGGPEELWGYTHGVAKASNYTQRRITGPHLKRWLHYKPGSGQTPSVLYGPNLTLTASLDVSETAPTSWQVYDLKSVGVAPGSTYEITGCDGAFEADEVTL